MQASVEADRETSDANLTIGYGILGLAFTYNAFDNNVDDIANILKTRQVTNLATVELNLAEYREDPDKPGEHC